MRRFYVYTRGNFRASRSLRLSFLILPLVTRILPYRYQLHSRRTMSDDYEGNGTETWYGAAHLPDSAGESQRPGHDTTTVVHQHPSTWVESQADKQRYRGRCTVRCAAASASVEVGTRLTEVNSRQCGCETRKQTRNGYVGWRRFFSLPLCRPVTDCLLYEHGRRGWRCSSPRTSWVTLKPRVIAAEGS